MIGGARLELPPGITGVISFGLCGGLDPALAAGDLVIGFEVAASGERFVADGEWVARLVEALPRRRCVRVAAGDTMITSPADKKALRRVTEAAIVDMESHHVARAAAARGLPFAVLRAVSDPADSALPLSAQVGLKANGDADIGAVLRALIIRPGELLALIRTAREASLAFRALGYARHLLGPGLGGPDVGEHLVDVA